MKITTIGKGNIGGGLGARWRNAGRVRGRLPRRL